MVISKDSWNKRKNKGKNRNKERDKNRDKSRNKKRSKNKEIKEIRTRVNKKIKVKKRHHHKNR